MNKVKASWIKERIKNESLFWCIVLAAFFFISYGYTNQYAAQVGDVPSFYFSWESRIPYLPWTIIPYLSSDLIFVICFLGMKSREEVRLLAKRIGFLILVSVICYRFFPLKTAFSRPESYTGIWKPWIDTLKLDLPYNQFPSLHVSEGILFWFVFLGWSHSLIKKVAVHTWFFLILLSTLTLYQHQFVDILGGVALALVSFIIFPELETKAAHRQRLAWMYLLLSWCLFCVVFFLHSNFMRIVPLYLSLNLYWVGLSYYTNKLIFLNKVNGRYSTLSLLLWGPFLFLCWLEWRIYSLFENSHVEVLPGLYFGRRLLPSEKISQFQIATIDLAPEISEVGNKIGYEYYYHPILDLGYPNRNQLIEITSLIDRLLKGGKQVYVHCRLGKSRSTFIIYHYLIHFRNVAPRDAIQNLKRIRKIHFPKTSELLRVVQ